MGMRVATGLQRARPSSAAPGAASVFGVPRRKGAGSSLGHEALSRTHDVSRSLGQPLDRVTRIEMGSLFGYDFSRVRIHTDSQAAQSARALQALAYTSGDDVMFATGRYSPHTRQGRLLLAHELAHVVQQEPAHPGALRQSAGHEEAENEARQVAATVTAGARVQITGAVPSGTLLRQGDTSSLPPVPNLQLTPPSLLQPSSPRLSLLPPDQQLQLRLDPALQLQSLLDPEMIRRALLAVDPSLFSAPQPSPLSLPSPAPAAPLVPRGAGPTPARAANAGDVLSAIMAVPSVKTAVTNLQNNAVSVARHDWQQLSTGEKVLTVSAGALLAGGTLAGILSNDSSRQFALQQIQGRNLPVPLVPGLSVRIDPIGPNRSVMFMLDLSSAARRLGM